MEVFVCGDICLSGDVEKLAQEHLLANLESIIGAEAVVVGNVECAISDRGLPKPYKYACLRASPQSVGLLKRLTIAVLANNHVTDYGDVAAGDTIQHLGRAGIRTVGYGDDLEDAARVTVVERSGVRLGIVAMSCPTTNGENLATPTSGGAAPLGMRLLKAAVQKAMQSNDAVLVYFHWGLEQIHDVVQDQIRLAHCAIDHGADAVVGCHGHVIQPYECYKGRWIFYGLGNLVFGPVDFVEMLPGGETRHGRQEQQLANRQSLAVKFTVVPDDADARMRLEAVHPMTFNDKFSVRPIQPRELTVNMEQMNQRLAQYIQSHGRTLARIDEPLFQCYFRNGSMAYFYSTGAIQAGLWEALLRRFWPRLRRLASKTLHFGRE